MVASSIVSYWYVVWHMLQALSLTHSFPILLMKLTKASSTIPVNPNHINEINTTEYVRQQLYLNYLTPNGTQYLDNSISQSSENTRGSPKSIVIHSMPFEETRHSRQKRSLYHRRRWDLNLTYRPSKNKHWKHPSRDRPRKRTDVRRGQYFTLVQKCNYVCEFCSNHVGLRWAGLCYLQCDKGGYAYSTCFTVFSLRHLL